MMKVAISCAFIVYVLFALTYTQTAFIVIYRRTTR
jgi:hypothetical protein